MVALASRQETQKPRSSPAYEAPVKEESPRPEPSPMAVEEFPLVCEKTQCIICIGNERYSYEKRSRCFQRVSHMMDHVENVHLKYQAADETVACHGSLRTWFLTTSTISHRESPWHHASRAKVCGLGTFFVSRVSCSVRRSDDDGCLSDDEQERSNTSKQSRWSKLDEQRLLAYKKEGKDWSWIFGKFPSRTSGAVRTRWHMVQCRVK